MRYYETLYIVNPNLENEALDQTMGEIRTELEKTKSKLINHRVWGKKRLAYQIDKQKYGSYILLHFEGGDQDQMNEFNTWMKLNNTVVRHMTVILDEKPEVYVEEVKEEPAEDKTTESVAEKAAPVEEAEVEIASEETEPVETDDTESTDEKVEADTPEEVADESPEEVQMMRMKL
jgi:small subunit ribosomal protein S6